VQRDTAQKDSDFRMMMKLISPWQVQRRQVLARWRATTAEARRSNRTALRMSCRIRRVYSRIRSHPCPWIIMPGRYSAAPRGRAAGGHADRIRSDASGSEKLRLRRRTRKTPGSELSSIRSGVPSWCARRKGHSNVVFGARRCRRSWQCCTAKKHSAPPATRCNCRRSCRASPGQSAMHNRCPGRRASRCFVMGGLWRPSARPDSLSA